MQYHELRPASANASHPHSSSKIGLDLIRFTFIDPKLGNYTVTARGTVNGGETNVLVGLCDREAKCSSNKLGSNLRNSDLASWMAVLALFLYLHHEKQVRRHRGTNELKDE